MNIGINASFLRKPGTGIGQVTLHFLRTVIADPELSAEHEFFLYLEDDIEPSLDLALPKNFRKHISLPFWHRDDLIRKFLWEKFCLPRIVAKDQCDVLLSLYQSATVLSSTKTKHVMLVHDIIPKLFPQYLDNMRKRIYYDEVKRGIRSSHAIVSVSQHTQNDLIEKLDVRESSVTVAPIAVDPLFAQQQKQGFSDEALTQVRSKYNIGKDYIYTGGGLEVRKNIEGTLRAYARIVKNGEQHVQLVISGRSMPGNPLATDVDALIAELDIADHVRVIGFVEQQDLPALYGGALFFCFPTHYEGFGMPLLEAMHMGTPVLSADNSSLPEVGGDAVLYCKSTDSDDISAKMELLLRDQRLRTQLSQKGLARAQQFSWTDFSHTLMQQLHTISKK